MRLQLFVILLTVGTLGIHTDAALTVEVLQSVGGLPPHIVGRFEEPIGFQQTPGGPYYVFDRRGHTVYAVDSDKTTVIKLVEIGPELGRIVQPRGFDTSPTGAFVVADAPRGIERVQIFGAGGLRLGGFTLPARQRTAALRVDSFVLNGIASIQYAGDNLLISHPESGALIAEYSRGGVALRSSGRPVFQKYGQDGRLLYERHIEGVEIDRSLAALPTRWPTGRVDDRELPLVTPAVRAAAVDGGGRLWISLMEPATYVYDGQGDKIRTVQFRAAGVMSPTGMFFTDDGRLLVTPGCYDFRP